MKNVKIVIAGGRDFRDHRLLYSKMHWVIEEFKNTDLNLIEVVSGKQVTNDKKTGEKYGADYIGELWAKEHGIPVKQFPADWNKLGRKAGPVRNSAMADYADGLVAFWDKKSKGTKNMIDNMQLRNKAVMVFTYT